MTDAAVMARGAAPRLELLRDTLARARGSRFYAPRLEALDTGNLAEAGFDTLAGLPLTTKAQLRDAGLDILAVPLGRTLRYYESSGTTGIPTPTPKTARDIASNTQGLLLNWRTYLSAETDRALLAVPSDLAPVADAMVCGLEALG